MSNGQSVLVPGRRSNSAGGHSFSGHETLLIFFISFVSIFGMVNGFTPVWLGSNFGKFLGIIIFVVGIFLMRGIPLIVNDISFFKHNLNYNVLKSFGILS